MPSAPTGDDAAAAHQDRTRLRTRLRTTDTDKGSSSGKGSKQAEPAESAEISDTAAEAGDAKGAGEVEPAGEQADQADQAADDGSVSPGPIGKGGGTGSMNKSDVDRAKALADLRAAQQATTSPGGS